MKASLSARLKEEIDKIIYHISELSQQKFSISRLLIYLKEDFQGQIWVLWTNSCRLENNVRLVFGAYYKSCFLRMS